MLRLQEPHSFCAQHNAASFPPPQVEVRPGKEGENLLAIHYQSQNSLTDLLLVQKKLFPDGTTLPPFGCGY